MYKYIIILGFLFFLASCGKPPEADFTWSPQEQASGQKVQFTNLSINAKSYFWNFGDMSIGSKENPAHSGASLFDLCLIDKFKKILSC